MTILIYILGLFLGLLGSRTLTVAGRGGVDQTKPTAIILSFVAMISTFVFIVWGFLELAWFIPILTFLFGSLIVGMLVRGDALVSLFRILPVLNIATIGFLVWFGIHALG
jgi:hypothetical protein